MTANQRRTASAGRWCARALLVLGGALAGTAAAWSIVTASAVAETPDTFQVPEQSGTAADSGRTPVTDAVNGSVGDLGRGVSDLAGAASLGAHEVSAPGHKAGPAVDDAPIRHREHQPIGEIGQLGDVNAAERARDATRDFADHAVIRPVQRTLGAVEQIVREPSDAPQVIDRTLTPPPEAKELGEAVWKLFHPNGKDLVELPELPRLPIGQPGAPAMPSPVAPAPAPAADPLPAAPMGPVVDLTAKPRHIELPGGTERGSSKDGHDSDGPSFPLPFSPGRAPLAPLSLPTVPGGSNAGGHCDASLFGIPAHAMSAVHSAATGTVRFGVRHLPLEPGAQPGVTPD
ncbi:hypothetical protein [Amycolatopsis nigrescens]|uniref:hypothetical protein n=1 Tax=Amycolatopsis nigrescens TaxID=381445 RepID=UPI00039D2D45|nr:hypothetical protein [Amycolatopsis nigrescens]